MTRRLPMFPLGTVLLPGERLPLHVFEPRYRALVADVRDDEGTFGVVLIERGSEVGGGDVRTDVGTEVALEAAEQYPDGRWGLVVLGVQRIRVVAWEPDAPYPCAQVTAFEDLDGAATCPAEVLQSLDGSARRVLALATEAGLAVAPTTFELPSGDVDALWYLASLVPLGAFDRQRVLAADSAVRRAAVLADVLDDVEGALRHRLAGRDDA